MKEMNRLDQAIRPAHRRYSDPIRDQIDAIYHWRVDDKYRKDGSERTLHFAAVVLKDGCCYIGTYRRSGSPYVRRHWYTAAVGRALKQAAAGGPLPFCIVDMELDRREQFKAIQAEVARP